MKKVIAIGIVFLFIMMSFTSISGIQIDKNIIKSSGRGNILYVGGSGEGNYTKIQDAIDNSSDGDTVFVFDDSSPYYETYIFINKSISLIGENRDTTVITGIHIKLNKMGVAISEFTLDDMSIMVSGLDVNNLVISNNHFISAVVNFDYVVNSTISSNTFNNHDFSIYNWGKNNIISNNIFICDQSIEYGLYEIFCMGGPHIMINNTLISYEKEKSRKGIYLEASSDNIIEGNIFDGYDSSGIMIYSGRNNLITHNNFINNDCGISVTIFSSSNKILNNNFLDNEQDAHSLIISKNIFDGNYWDEWIGLKYPILSFLPYFSYDFLSSIIDWHPAKEPYNYTSTQGCGIE